MTTDDDRIDAAARGPAPRLIGAVAERDYEGVRRVIITAEAGDVRDLRALLVVLAAMVPTDRTVAQLLDGAPERTPRRPAPAPLPDITPERAAANRAALEAALREDVAA